MALLTISGEPASRFEDAAHAVSRSLDFQLVTESRLEQWIAEEFGGTVVPPRLWRPAVITILARMATEHHLVIAIEGSESLLGSRPFLLRAGILASPNRRIGNLMLELRADHPDAKTELHKLDADSKKLRKARFGRSAPLPVDFDIALNADQMDSEQIAEVLCAAARARGLAEQGMLSPAAEAELQFPARVQLARRGIVPAGRAHLKPITFGHPSEEMFANLLDFYRIQWEYEPRSFPLQWDKNGNVLEAFTPDFYMPEFDLYVELTTMKQALVTRKNRKIKLLRAVYPHVNIQIFYQKDFQDLFFKYGLRGLPQQ